MRDRCVMFAHRSKRVTPDGDAIARLELDPTTGLSDLSCSWDRRGRVTCEVKVRAHKRPQYCEITCLPCASDQS